MPTSSERIFKSRQRTTDEKRLNTRKKKCNTKKGVCLADGLRMLENERARMASKRNGHRHKLKKAQNSVAFSQSEMTD